MSTAVGILKTFKLSKQQLNSFAQTAIEEALEGDHDLLELYATLKGMEDMTKVIKKGIHEHVLEEANKYPGKSFDHKGVTFTGTVRKSYDYSSDPTWIALDMKKKAREKLMQTIQEPLADTETGEIIQPAGFKSSESISVKLPA